MAVEEKEQVDVGGYCTCKASPSEISEEWQNTSL